MQNSGEEQRVATVDVGLGFLRHMQEGEIVY